LACCEDCGQTAARRHLRFRGRCFANNRRRGLLKYHLNLSHGGGSSSVLPPHTRPVEEITNLASARASEDVHRAEGGCADWRKIFSTQVGRGVIGKGAGGIIFLDRPNTRVCRFGELSSRSVFTSDEMCPSSRRIHYATADRSGHFDSTRRVLIKEYKQTTADTSQVCDGRNFDLLRQIKESHGSVLKKYRPTRQSRSGTEREACDEVAARLRPPVDEVAVDRRSGHHQSLSSDISPKKCGQDVEEVVDDDESSRPPDESESDEHSNYSEHRRSQSEMGENREPLSQEPQQPRRLSADSCKSQASSSSASKITVRKLSEPMHRCKTTNLNVYGIMRPARYSSNNLAAMDTSHHSSTSGRRLSYAGASESSSQNLLDNINSKPNLNASFNSCEVENSGGMVGAHSSVGHGLNSMQGLGRMRRRASYADLKSASQNATWVAHGVNFSKSMEVYVFKS